MVAEKPPAVRPSQPLSVAAGARFVAYRRPRARAAALSTGRRRLRRRQRGVVETIMTELALAGEQHRHEAAPARLERRVGIDVELFHLAACRRGPGRHGLAHLVAKVAVGAHQQGEPQPLLLFFRH